MYKCLTCTSIMLCMDRFLYHAFFFINLQRDKWNFKFLWHFCQYMQIKTDLPCDMVNSLLQETPDRILIFKFLIKSSVLTH